MQFALTCNNRLAEFSIDDDKECRVFFMQRMQTVGDSIFLSFDLRFDGHPNNRLRKFYRQKIYGQRTPGERIVRMRVFQFNDCTDISRNESGNFLTFFTVHHKDLTKAFCFSICLILQIESGCNNAWVDAKKRKFADMFFRNRFKDKQRRLFWSGGFQSNCLFLQPA